MHKWRLLIVMICVLGLGRAATAGVILSDVDFDPYPIIPPTFSTSGGFAVGLGLPSPGGFSLPFPNGFSTVSMSYGVISVDGLPVTVSWTSSRMFDVIPPSLIAEVSLFGSTEIFTTGGTGTFFVDGFVDGFPHGSHVSSAVPGPQSWDVTSAPFGLSGGTHTLTIESGVHWVPAFPGDVLTVSSFYDITLDPSSLLVPLPVAAWLGIPAAGLVGLMLRRQRVV